MTDFVSISLCKLKKGVMFIRILFVFVIFNNLALAAVKMPKEQVVNDISVYSLEDDFLPIISVNIAFENAGVVYQEKDLVGINAVVSYLSNNLLFVKDRESFSNEIANRNLSVSFSSDMENFYISLNFTRSDQEFVKKFLKSFFYEFEVSQTDINKAVKYINYAKTNSYLNSNFVSNQNLKNNFFEKPFNRDGFIEADKSSMINAVSIKNFVQALNNKKRLKLAIVGDLRQHELEGFVSEVFDGFENRDFAKDIKPRVKDYATYVKYFPGYDQIVFYSAIQGIKRNAENFYAFYLLNHLIGGSARNSFISTRLREDEGLTYSSYSYVNYFYDFGYMVLYFATDKAKYREAKAVYYQLLDEIKYIDFSQQDLDAAKKFLMGKYDISFTSNSKISGFLIGLMLNDLPANMLIKRNDFVEAVTLEDINNVRDQIFMNQDFTTVITGAIN